MNPDIAALPEFPQPTEGLLVTTLLIVRDLYLSRKFYEGILGGTVITAGPPLIVKLSNSWIILNIGGGSTDDKPDVVSKPPAPFLAIDVPLLGIPAIPKMNVKRRRGILFLDYSLPLTTSRTNRYSSHGIHSAGGAMRRI
jgi:hypothetical protein